MNKIDGPKEPPYVFNSNIPVYHTSCPKRKKNWLHMKFADTTVDVSLEDKHVGSISGCLGGGIEITIRSGKKKGNTYLIKSTDIWKAVCESLELTEEDLIGEEE